MAAVISLQESALAEVVFARAGSIAHVIENLLASSQTSIDAALHRLNSQRLARALADARERGVSVRLLIDRSKFEKSQATRKLLSACDLPFRLANGRDGAGSKMHHKFALLDKRLVITGSYNWTFASEARNHENIVLLREAGLVDTFHHEFEALWAESETCDPLEKRL
jgi:phosphatidylserine/phosphatidylglycerophosphate/cardiolipin synthase-like enzyme